MPGTAGPNLGLTSGWSPAETGWGNPFNADMLRLDSLVMGAVINATTTAPPGSPAEGDRYIVTFPASGVWAGRATQIASWNNGAWVYYAPKVGWEVHDISTDRILRFDGTSWGPRKAVVHPGVISSFTNYLFSPVDVLSTVAAAVVPNRMYWKPFLLPGAVVDTIGIDVTTLAAGNCRLGLYRSLNGVPSSLLVDAGTVSTGAVATVTASFTALTLPDQWVWAVAIFDATPQCRNGGIGAGWLVGSNSFSAGWRALYSDTAYGVLPSTAPGLTGGAPTAPLIGLRKA